MISVLNGFSSMKRDRAKYPFKEMSAGDYFIVEPEEVKRVRSAASAWSRKWGIKMSVVKSGEVYHCGRPNEPKILSKKDHVSDEQV